MGRSKRTLREAHNWLNVSIVGIQFPVAIAIGFLWGRWLDGQLGTRPWMTLVFSLFGIAAGFVNLFRITAAAGREEERLAKQDSQDEDRNGRPSD